MDLSIAATAPDPSSTLPADRATQPTDPGAGPQLRVAIHILADGRVVFGDLPPELAEVASILAGEAGDKAVATSRASEAVAQPVGESR